MNWEAIGAIGEVIGGLVVIISLLYLARQMRQSTDQTKMQSSQAVDNSNMLAFDPIYIPENSVIWTKGHADPNALTDHERHMFGMFMARLMGASFNTTSSHYARGMYDEELYKNVSAYFRTVVSTPGGSQWYRENRQFLHSEAQAQLDSAVPGLE